MKSKWLKLITVCAIILVQICRATHPEDDDDDEILSLPGQPTVTFKQYGGYIPVDEKQDRALFYYLVEAESNPDSKPLLLWLNGGPGCSSVGIAFTSHGPFRPTGGSNLIRHNYSWNREANVLYLESPAGVGFSYSANDSFYKNVNDTITAQDNLKFMEQWLLKYPKYKHRDFYMGGESYAGHFVPQLAQLLVKSRRVNFNFKGIVIGNPLMEFDTDIQAEAEFFLTHGLISDSTYKLMNSICNNTQFWREKYITRTFSPACLQINSTLAQEIPASLDVFHVTGDTCLSSSGHESQSDEVQKGSDENVDVCGLQKASEYLNREDVREAMHGQLIGATSKWEYCSGIVNAHYDLRNLEIPTIDVVGSLVTSGIRVFVYSGDADSRVPFKGTRALLDGLAKRLGLNTTVSHRAWFVDKQVGGWTQVYGGDTLTFATIRGGGHIAPSTSPKRALTLFSAFLAGAPPPEA